MNHLDCHINGTARFLHIFAIRNSIWVVRIDEQRDDFGLRHDITQQPDSLRSKSAVVECQPRKVAARPVEASYETVSNGITAVHKNDRNSCGCGFGRNGGDNTSCREDYGHDCRHTWATWHYAANRDLGALQ